MPHADGNLDEIGKALPWAAISNQGLGQNTRNINGVSSMYLLRINVHTYCTVDRRADREIPCWRILQRLAIFQNTCDLNTELGWRF